jgi:hypothetical protein
MTSHAPDSPAARRSLPWVLALALLGWWSQGVWPFVPLEGDEQGVIFGVHGMVRNDALLLPLRYLYEIQPGSYQLLGGLCRLTGAPVESVFGTVTALGALLFAVAGARLLGELCEIPFAWALVGMLWCQEVSTAAYYMNTSAFAGGIAVAAVLWAGRPASPARWLAAGLALGCAGWLRSDSLLIAPACLGVIYWRERRWPAALLRTAGIALCSGLTLALLFKLSGLSVTEALQTFSGRPAVLSAGREIRDVAVMLLSPTLALGFLVGLAWLLRQRRFALGGVVVLGMGLSLLAYGASLTTPKYFYYLVPFALIPSLLLARHLTGWVTAQPAPARWIGLAAVLALALGDQLVGFRIMSTQSRLLTTAPTAVTLVRVPLGSREPALVVGPGELVANADGFRVRTGQAFAPWCWRREKLRLASELTAVRALLEQNADSTFYWASWLPRQLLFRELLGAGFTPDHTDQRDMMDLYDGRWRRGSQTVQVGFLGYTGSRDQPPGPAPASRTPAATYFLGTGGGKWSITELADRRAWHQVSAVAEGFVTLHQRR